MKALMKRLTETVMLLCALILTSLLTACAGSPDGMKARVAGMYGENHEISGSYDEMFAAACSNGTFVGQNVDGVTAYKGIPYAKAPTGELRWKPPVPAEDGGGTYEAYYFGPSPIQTEWPSEPGSYYPQSEDCLYLNVWTNSSNKAADKPVMVFFHGGSYGWGATSDPIYDGHNLISKYDDIVLVSVEFRAGLLGFIDFTSVAGGEDYKESGNLGLLDQKCATRLPRSGPGRSRDRGYRDHHHSGQVPYFTSGFGRKLCIEYHFAVLFHLCC